MMKMKVLTIKQPFATLIAEGIKKYEFRTWRTHFRGEFLIHAGKGVDKKAMKKYEHLSFNYPNGAIIAKVKLTECHKVDANFRNILKEKNPVVYSNVIKSEDWEGYAFELHHVEKIEPIYINGKLGLWNYDEK